jgi:hypothetical protein
VGGTTLASFKNFVKMKTPIAVAGKAQQFPRISTPLMMAEQAEIHGAASNFKRLQF